MVAVAMAEAVLEARHRLGAISRVHFGEYPVGIVGMQTLDPELFVVAHLPRR